MADLRGDAGYQRTPPLDRSWLGQWKDLASTDRCLGLPLALRRGPFAGRKRVLVLGLQQAAPDMNLALMVEEHPDACQRHGFRIIANARCIDGIHPRDTSLVVCRFIVSEVTCLIGCFILLDERHDACHLGILSGGMFTLERGQGGQVLAAVTLAEKMLRPFPAVGLYLPCCRFEPLCAEFQDKALVVEELVVLVREQVLRDGATRFNIVLDSDEPDEPAAGSQLVGGQAVVNMARVPGSLRQCEICVLLLGMVIRHRQRLHLLQGGGACPELIHDARADLGQLDAPPHRHHADAEPVGQLFGGHGVLVD